MIYSELKIFEEILKITKEENLLLLACNGCAEVCKVSDDKSISEIEEKLKTNGKKIKRIIKIDFMCNKNLIVRKLSRFINDFSDNFGILVFSCGIGVQCVSNVIEKPIYPATNTIYLGGFQGLWPGEERCAECGMCYLGITGGICPITFCTKQLINGPCGGTNNGKCEIDSEKDCGWALIYEKLKRIEKLEILKEYQEPRNYKLCEPTGKIRKKIFYDVDKNEEL
ncbi:MAG: methylenetetrahydrofolate reductase C-terminal domain-containing protein [Candidatus Omnitrophica bacterium]|nr:methylenetetrahydrofolate reductase C-terminal domain-containing protein [Candidatus Omnitrophota bacterium]MCM8802119.1 methylenetetrahydrofolate reductase C-terminal domain-containing protein [Candidatus Omnitrophota bacterium]